MFNRYIFDLDNTLVYTDALNNSSYNYVLIQKGLSPIKDSVRITRDVVVDKYPNLNYEHQRELIMLKQEYFINNLQDTKPNISIIKILKSKDPEYCYLWTSADEIRVQALVEYYNIKDAFKKIIYCDKSNVLQDIEKLCELCKYKSE